MDQSGLREPRLRAAADQVDLAADTSRPGVAASQAATRTLPANQSRMHVESLLASAEGDGASSGSTRNPERDLSLPSLGMLAIRVTVYYR